MKRFLSALLGLCMLLTLLPASTFAVEAHPGDSTEIAAAPQDAPAAAENEAADSVPEFVPGVIPEQAEYAYPSCECFGAFLGDSEESYGFTRNSDGTIATVNGQSPVKNQGSNGLCWTFGTYAALEAHMKKDSKDVDFSELHMGYSTSNKNNDGSSGGNTLQGWDRAPGGGGNRSYSSAYLMRGTSLSGTVSEDADPYIEAQLPDRPLSVSESKTQTYQAQNILFLTGSRLVADAENTTKLAEERSVIKKAVISYGGVGASMYYAGQTTATDGSGTQEYYNAATCSYYYNGKSVSTNDNTLLGTNHLVEIAGWDDSYSKDNFNAGHRPGSNGAWLVKNSWGTGWGDKGYFWVSYEDTNFPLSTFCFAGIKPYNHSQTVYETDYTAGGAYSGYSGSTTGAAYFARIYTTQTDNETLTSVRFMLNGPKTVQVGTAEVNSDGTLKDSDVFTPLAVTSSESGISIEDNTATLNYPGWYTLDITGGPTYTAAGTKFAVVIKVTKNPLGAEGKTFCFPYDDRNPPPAGTAYNTTNTSVWTESQNNYCIKAVTTPSGTDADQVIANKAAAELVWDTIKNENTAENQTCTDLALPAGGKYGTTISWASSNTDIIRIDGTVTRPRFDKKNEVTLTATVTVGSASIKKTFELTVPHRTATDEDKYEAAENWLKEDMGSRWWPSVKGDNTSQSCIRYDLVKPDKLQITIDGIESYDIEVHPEAAPRKASNNDEAWDCVGKDGKVTRPAYGQSNSQGYFCLFLKKAGTSYASIDSQALTVLAYQGKINSVAVADATVAAGSSGTLTATVDKVGSPGAYTYKWYSSATNSNTGGTLIEGATSASFTIPAALAAGEHYYYCEVSAIDAAETKTSDVATVTVDAASATVKPLTENMVTLSKTEAAYTGSEIKPGVTVKDGETVLTENAHYTITWKAEGTAAPAAALTNTGAYTVTVAAKDGSGYTGSVEKTFQITNANPTVTAPASLAVKTGMTGTFDVAVTGVKGEALSGDLTVVSSDTSVATATVSGKTVAVKGVKAGSATITVAYPATTNYNPITLTLTVTVRSDTPSGGGSSGGGGGGTSSPTVSTGSASQGGSTVKETTAAPAAFTEDNKATSSVSGSVGSEIVKQAVANKSESVVIAPEIKDCVTKTEVSIPASTVGKIGSETKAALTVSTPVADVTIPNGGLDELSRAGGAVTITAEQTGSTVELSVTAGGRTVGTIPGGMKVTVPVEKPTAGTVAVLVHEDGTREIIRKSVADGASLTIPLDGSAKVEILDNSKRFGDVPASSWAADAVSFVSSHELFNGTGGGQFSPDLSMNRAMLAVVLHNLEGNPSRALTGAFGDVDNSKWYAEGVTWAADRGIVKGYGDGQFAPNDDITREQLAVMLWRYAGSPAATGSGLSFTDAGKISSWAMEAMRWAAEKGIINGKGNGILDPTGNATRAQTAQMLKNFLENQ